MNSNLTECSNEITFNNSKECAIAFRMLWSKNSFFLNERFYALYLDKNYQLIDHYLLNIGVLKETYLDPRALVFYAMDTKANHVVICHNHPSGDCNPSKMDIEMTKTIKTLLDILSIGFGDHIILSPTSYYSFADMKII